MGGLLSRHITHVITKLDVGGAQTHVVELAIGQVRAGDRVDVVTGLGGPAADRLVAAGIPVRIAPELGRSHGRLSQRAALAAVTEAMRESPPDVVHGHSSNAGLAARRAARRLQLPSVYTAHGWPFQKGAPWKQRAMSFAGEFVGGHLGDAVIVLTDAERDRAVRARVVPRHRLWVVPNGIADVASRRRPGGWDAREPILVMVARFAPPKRQLEFVQVLARLVDHPWRALLVGDGPELEPCREAAANAGLGARVEFLGHRDDVGEILSGADIGVLWSRYEGLPISVMEYLRAGLCCVASDLPGTRQLIGGTAGRLAADASRLEAALAELLGDPELIDVLGAAARQRYLDGYSADAMVAATSRVYDTVTERRVSR